MHHTSISTTTYAALIRAFLTDEVLSNKDT